MNVLISTTFNSAFKPERSLLRRNVSLALTVLLALMPVVLPAQFTFDFICGEDISIDAVMKGTVDSTEATIFIPGDTSTIDSILVEIAMKGDTNFWNSTTITTSAGEVVVVNFPGIIENTGSNEEAALYRVWVGPCRWIHATTPVTDTMHFNDWQSMTTFQVRHDPECISGTISGGDVLLFHACDTFYFELDSISALTKDVSIIAPISELGDADTVRSAIIVLNYIHNGVVTNVSNDTFYGSDNLGNNALLFERLLSVPGEVDTLQVIIKSPDNVFSNTSCSDQFPFGGDSFIFGTMVVTSECVCCVVETECDVIPDAYLCSFDLIPTIPEALLDDTVIYSGNINLDSLAFTEFGGAYDVLLCDTLYIVGVDDSTGAGCPGDTGFVSRIFTFHSLLTGEVVGTCELNYVVLDSLGPVITCPTDTTLQCIADVFSPYLSLTEFIAAGGNVSDDCGLNESSFTLVSEISDGLNCPETISRTYGIADSCGTFSTCVQIIVINDTIAPVITCSPDITIECSDPIPEGIVNATDNCDADVLVLPISGIVMGDCPNEFIIFRSWTATDDCGNSATCAQSVTIVDTTPPEISCPADVTVDCDDEPFVGEATALDNCDPLPFITFVDITEPGSCPQEFTISRTWYATDACGNISSCVQTIVVDDSDAPLLTMPDDISIQCGDEPTGAATAVDACSDVFVTYVDLQCSVTVEGFTGAYDFTNWTATEPNGGDVTTSGDDQVTLTGPDGANCSGLSTLFSITIPADGKLIFSWNYSTNDSDGPSFDPFGYSLNGIFVQLTQDVGEDAQSGLAAALVSAGDVFAFEQHSTDCIFGEAATTVIDFFVFTCVEEEPLDLCNYTVFRCWSATDECGNTAYGLQRIHVEDTQAPILNCPVDLTLDCTESTDPVSTGFATATDNCDTEVTIIYADVINGMCPYVISRTWTATDSCGNAASCVQQIIVDDTTPPSLACPPGGDFDCGAENLFFASLEDFLAAGGSVSDNCGLDSASFTLASGTGVGPCPTVFTFLYTVTDLCGNLASCVHVVTISDDIPPTIICPADVELECSIGELPPYATLNAFLAAGGDADDNCALDSVSFTLQSEVSDGLTCPEIITRTYRIADFCGNVSTCVHLISVDDTTPPDITCSPDITIECSDPVPAGVASAADNCDPEPTILPASSITPGECVGEYIIFRSWTATDECGNTALCEQTVTIIDTTPPQITCPADITWECNVSTDPINTGMASAIDNCDMAPVITYDDILDPGACFTITRIWTATDDCGNSSTCVQIITVEDDTPPGIVCPTNVTVECDESTDPEETGMPTVTDFCDPMPGLDYSDSAGPGICHTITRTWTATDACGNSTSCVQLIVVDDITPPAIVCPPDVTLEGSESTDPADTGSASATDNCDASPDITYSDQNIPGPCSEDFSIRRIWTATDDCGNSAQCTQTLHRDDEPPGPVCRASVVVSLNVMGMAVVPAEAFDGGSFDNCGPVYFKVKRMTPPDGFDCFYNGNELYQFDDYVKFCCEDIGNGNIMIILRVYDVLPIPGIVSDDYLLGHFADCMLEVEVQDKLPPTIECPTDLTISCEFDFDPDNLSVFGDVVTDPADREDICIDDPGNPYTSGLTCIGLDGIAIDNCSVTVTDTAIIDINMCGTGTIRRIFTATDPGGFTASCEQRITIIDYTPFDTSDIVWPPDYMTTDICQVDLLDPEDLPAPFDHPVVNDDECALVTYTHDDIVFDFSNSHQACFKILRTWTVLDWCQYQVGGGNGIWIYTQVIKVHNTVGPEITLADDQFDICTDDPACGPGNVLLEASATDDCSGPEALRWNIGVDEHNNGSLEQFYPAILGSIVELNIELPLGTHRILYSVEDFCGNITTEEQYITMESCKPPSAKCRNLTTTLMPVDTDGDLVADDGMVTLWATDFDAGSDHACGNDIQLAFSANPADVSRIFDCDDLGENLIELWVIDENGNTDFCIVTLTIQDNFNVCPEDPEQRAIVEGIISTSLSELVPSVNVNLHGSNVPPQATDSSGHYAFPPMPMGGDYVVEPVLDIEHKKGVSTLDLIILQKHLLGIKSFESPYQFIAGDANHSENLSAMDIVTLRRLILGITETIPNNTSWRFVDAAYQFSDSLNPLIESFPETYSISSLNTDMHIDFVAIKVGDVNGSVMNDIANTSVQTRNGPGIVPLYMSDQKLKTGETTIVEIICDQLDAIEGMQFTLGWNPQDVDVVPVSTSGILSEPHWNASRLNAGVLPLSWTKYDVDLSQNGKVLFALEVTAKRNMPLSQSGLHINSSVTTMEGQLFNGTQVRPYLEVLPVISETDELIVYQNRPNPFVRKTMIPCNVPTKGMVRLEVYNMEGKLVYQTEAEGIAGYHEFLLDVTQLGDTGVYTYTISTATEYRTLRMIVIGE